MPDWQLLIQQHGTELLRDTALLGRVALGLACGKEEDMGHQNHLALLLVHKDYVVICRGRFLLTF